MMVLHFIADFLMQSREMGQKKSSDPRWLLKHLWIQTWVFAVGLTFFVGPLVALLFALCNSSIHGIIDWWIWKAYKLSAHLRIKKEANQYGNPEEAYKIGVERWQYW